MCTYSVMIDQWRDKSWPFNPHPGVPSFPNSPNAIPWPMIQADPKLAQQMLDILAKLEAIDKRLGHLEQCKVAVPAKKKLKRSLQRIAKSAIKRRAPGASAPRVKP